MYSVVSVCLYVIIFCKQDYQNLNYGSLQNLYQINRPTTLEMINFWCTLHSRWLISDVLVSTTASVLQQIVYKRIHSATATIQLALDMHHSECSLVIACKHVMVN